MKNSIRLSKSVIGTEEIQAVTKVLKKEFLGMGEEVLEFEKEISSYIGSPAVCVNTGTAALHLALLALDVKKNDLVITTPITFLALLATNCAIVPVPV